MTSTSTNSYLPASHRAITLWLLMCCSCIFLMVVIGGITRLTGSGLSMVEWQPIMGAIPPLNEIEWQRVFQLYQSSPEFEKVNFGMDLSAFKEIFFWEWLHRLLGRFIGVLYAVPFLVFLLFGKIPKIYLPSFFGFFLLGGAQGLMGWYMVQSGLVDDPAVSHFRLAAHLGLAILIYALMFNMALRLSLPLSDNAAPLTPLRPMVTRCLIALGITMLWGAFVAGLDAGLIYNEFPMMGEYPWPQEALEQHPLWLNPLTNPATVQFIHRVLAMISGLMIIGLSLHSRNFVLTPRVRRAFTACGVMVAIQITLGIITLLTQVQLHVAVSHQAGALILLTLLLWTSHEIPRKDFSEAKSY